MPFEKFLKKFDHPHFLAEAHFVAVDKQGSTDPSAWCLAGVAQLGVDPDHKQTAHTWITGVRRAYRRKGLARALKRRGIQYAAAYGIRLIETDIDENNPMYSINLSLGFEPQPALLALRLHLATD